MEVGCVIFGMKHKKRQKKNARDNGLQSWNDMAVWRDFKPQIYGRNILSTWRSQSGASNRNRPIHGLVTMHIDGFVPFAAHAKRMIRLI